MTDRNTNTNNNNSNTNLNSTGDPVEPAFVKADTATWVEALAEYDAAKAAAAAGDMSADEGAAELRLLQLPAPDLSALRQKLEVLWGQELWEDDDDGQARRVIIGDLRRLENEVGASPPEAQPQVDEGRGEGDRTQRPAAQLSEDWRVPFQGDDVFWGHLGIKLPTEDNTRWWPITARMREHLDADIDGWIAVPTLVNRLVIFHLDRVDHIWLLDDNCPAPSDWTVGTARYKGMSMSFYAALGAWAQARLGDGQDDRAALSADLEQEIAEYVHELGLVDAEHVLAHVRETRVALLSGATRSYHVDPGYLALLVEQLEHQAASPTQAVELPQSDGDMEIIYPLSQLALVEAPLTELDAADQEMARLAEPRRK